MMSTTQLFIYLLHYPLGTSAVAYVRFDCNGSCINGISVHRLACTSVLQRANGLFGFVVIYNAIFGATWGAFLRCCQRKSCGLERKDWRLRLSPTGASILRLVCSLLPVCNGYLISHHRWILLDQFGDGNSRRNCQGHVRRDRHSIWRPSI
ncbi:hypothetical protein V1505DRAFT_381510 [Lipomyces doorenjongii]